MLEWYVVPLIAIAVYVYAVEVERRRWDLVLCGLAFWGMDWLNEIANGLILHFTQHSALWTAPARSAYIIFVGLNVEICFMRLNRSRLSSILRFRYGLSLPDVVRVPRNSLIFSASRSQT